MQRQRIYQFVLFRSAAGIQQGLTHVDASMMRIRGWADGDNSMVPAAAIPCLMQPTAYPQSA